MPVSESSAQVREFVYRSRGGKKLLRLTALFPSDEWDVTIYNNATKFLCGAVITHIRSDSRRVIRVEWHTGLMDGDINILQAMDWWGVPVALGLNDRVDPEDREPVSFEQSLFELAIRWTDADLRNAEKE
jgi:hypothetical protein